MDDASLNRELSSLCQKAILEARAAVDAAPDGEWIAGSEWEVQDVFQRLKRDCYQIMLQARADSAPSVGQADFSPSAGRDAAEQGRAASPGAERRRRG